MLEKNGIRGKHILQCEGDAVFIPSGAIHQVILRLDAVTDSIKSGFEHKLVYKNRVRLHFTAMCPAQSYNN